MYRNVHLVMQDDKIYIYPTLNYSFSTLAKMHGANVSTLNLRYVFGYCRYLLQHNKLINFRKFLYDFYYPITDEEMGYADEEEIRLRPDNTFQYTVRQTFNHNPIIRDDVGGQADVQ